MSQNKSDYFAFYVIGILVKHSLSLFSPDIENQSS